MVFKKSLSAGLFFCLIMAAGSFLILGSIVLCNNSQWRKNGEFYSQKDYNDRWEKSAQIFRVQQRGKYFVLHNFISAEDIEYGNQSITIVTQGTYHDLKYIPGLVKIWNGPISMSLFTNGKDFNTTVKTILHILECSPYRRKIDRLVSFHFVFHNEHFPDKIPKGVKHHHQQIACNHIPDSMLPENKVEYWRQNSLIYPVNVLRNVGRASVTTFYMADLEVNDWPLNDFIQNVLKFTENNDMKPNSILCLPFYPNAVPLSLQDRYSDPLELYYAYVKKNPNSFGYDQLDLNFQSNMNINSVSQNLRDCSGKFLAINKFLPLYDEHMAYNDPYEKNELFELLSGLNYDFVILNGTATIEVGKNSLQLAPPKINFNLETSKKNYNNYMKAWKQFQGGYHIQYP